jgi:pimeloyl-ACP methyl ester carboxylesterase
VSPAAAATKLDGIVSAGYGRAYAKRIPGAQFEIIDDAGHFPHIEQSKASMAAVCAFIED